MCVHVQVSVQDGLQAFLLGTLETLAADAATELMMGTNVDLIALGCAVTPHTLVCQVAVHAPQVTPCSTITIAWEYS